jgi:seryl-tRNA synthetase
MIDLKAYEQNFEEYAKRLARKGVEKSQLDKLKEAFLKNKEAKKELEEYQAKQNSMSKLFPQYKKEGKDISELKAMLDENKSKIAEASKIVNETYEELERIASTIPNPPDDIVPDGESEDDNVELKRVLEPREFDFEPKEHWELAEKNRWIDFKRGVKIAKSRFSISYSEGAQLQRALINFMLDFLIKRDFVQVSVPYLVNAKTLYGTGQLPKFEDDLFKIEDENLYLIPTAEVPVTNYFQDEIIDNAKLNIDFPLYMCCYSSCFRKEAGSAGRDTRGIIRQHQFDKVEMVTITKPEQSDEVFDFMVQTASEMLSALELPHRLVELCTGDLGFSAARTIDLEVWLPGQDCYREISSVSNTRDFQARRAKIRYKDGKKNRFVHTLNGSALAVGRTMVAIMENYQQKDGSIKIPKVLEEYMKIR